MLSILPKDIENVCFSYLDANENIYYKNEWNKFNENETSNIAAKYGWIDLLEWSIINDCRWQKPYILNNAAQYGHYIIFEWFENNNFEVNYVGNQSALDFNRHSKYTLCTHAALG